MKTASLPKHIEQELSEFEKRQRRHQAMLDEHQERKNRRREEHRARHFARSIPPNTLV